MAKQSLLEVLSFVPTEQGDVVAAVQKMGEELGTGRKAERGTVESLVEKVLGRTDPVGNLFDSRVQNLTRMVVLKKASHRQGVPTVVKTGLMGRRGRESDDEDEEEGEEKAQQEEQDEVEAWAKAETARVGIDCNADDVVEASLEMRRVADLAWRAHGEWIENSATV